MRYKKSFFKLTRVSIWAEKILVKFQLLQRKGLATSIHIIEKWKPNASIYIAINEIQLWKTPRIEDISESPCSEYSLTMPPSICWL